MPIISVRVNLIDFGDIQEDAIVRNFRGDMPIIVFRDFVQGVSGLP
jgi:hypothetical protein